MELVARGLSIPYGTPEEYMAIQAVKAEWNGQYLSSMAALSAQMETSSVQRVMENVSDHYFPMGKYERAAKLTKFQESFEKLRKHTNLQIKNGVLVTN